MTELANTYISVKIQQFSDYLWYFILVYKFPGGAHILGYKFSAGVYILGV